MCGEKKEREKEKREEKKREEKVSEADHKAREIAEASLSLRRRSLRRTHLLLVLVGRSELLDGPPRVVDGLADRILNLVEQLALYECK